MRKKLTIIALAIIGSLVIYSLIHQITDSVQAEKRLSDEINKLTKLQAHQQQLNQQLAQINTADFIETQARNKLNLARPGETVVIIPQSEIDKVLHGQKPTAEAKLPNWQGWLKLFLR